MLNHQPPPNWVLGRAECNLRMTFEVLSEIVERDVEQANKVLGNHQFRIERCTEGVRPRLFVSERGAEKGIGVRFEMSETAIRINGGGVQFYIRAQSDGTKCRMHINDESHAHELWEISQRALGNLFFRS